MKSVTVGLLFSSLVLPVTSIFFGQQSGCDACSQYGGYNNYGQNYGQSYGQDYSSYQPQQSYGYNAPQQNVINGKFIIRHKIYQPVIRRTTVELIPQSGTVSRPYSTEFVPEQSVSEVTANQGYEAQGYIPSNYGQNYAYGQNYGSSAYGAASGYANSPYGTIG
ncbi:hypothetical protein M3Y98_00171900 [Aphelenchoides besseyi]|nr:hypothetical protein M3Y98_00171900 [Aphelenchoides besseyi]KAI6200015.1 hypothetical protein M3Y96_00688600 [Aphelenchoides besseyi]